jgi:hypothetical protein
VSLKKARVKAKSLANRISGVSVGPHGVGISWKPPELERDVVRKLIIFLEDKRALYIEYDREVRDYVKQSLLQIRDALTDAVKDVGDSSPARDSLRMMRAACRAFDNKVSEQERHHRHAMEEEFFVELGKLRAIFGMQIAILAYLYNIDVEEGLASILPPDPG